MGTIVRIHFNNIVDDLEDWQIRELMSMLEKYLDKQEEE